MFGLWPKAWKRVDVISLIIVVPSDSTTIESSNNLVVLFFFSQNILVCSLLGKQAHLCTCPHLSPHVFLLVYECVNPKRQSHSKVICNRPHCYVDSLLNFLVFVEKFYWFYFNLITLGKIFFFDGSSSELLLYVHSCLSV